MGSELEPSSNVSEVSDRPDGCRRKPIVLNIKLAFAEDQGAAAFRTLVFFCVVIAAVFVAYRWSSGSSSLDDAASVDAVNVDAVNDGTADTRTSADQGEVDQSTAEQSANDQSNSDQSDGDQILIGTVVFVIDGDTVDMEIDGERERVRLLGIDAPESVHRSVPEQCFGAESSAALTELLPIGSEVNLERDLQARDRYGRLLLYLYRSEDGLFVNEWLVRNGFADTSFYEPNTTHANALTEVRGEARAERTGLWGSCDGPDQPLD